MFIFKFYFIQKLGIFHLLVYTFLRSLRFYLCDTLREITDYQFFAKTRKRRKRKERKKV